MPPVAPRREGLYWISEGSVRTGMDLRDVEQRILQVCLDILRAPRDLQARQQPRGFQVDFVMCEKWGSHIGIDWRRDENAGRPRVHFVVRSRPAHLWAAPLGILAATAVAAIAGAVSTSQALGVWLGITVLVSALDVFTAGRNSTRAANAIVGALGVHPMAPQRH
jgi:hypothetical protein